MSRQSSKLGTCDVNAKVKGTKHQHSGSSQKLGGNQTTLTKLKCSCRLKIDYGCQLYIVRLHIEAQKTQQHMWRKNNNTQGSL